MEIFDDFLKKLTEAADYTVKEAEKLTGAAKIKFAILEEQGRIDSALEKLGKLYYETRKKEAAAPKAETGAENEADECSGDDFEADVNADAIIFLCGELDKRYERLEKLSEEQAILKRYRYCDGCKGRIDKESTFCPKCGMKQG